MDPDGSSSSILRFVVFGLCLIASAFFSASETSLLTIGKIRAKSLSDEGAKNADVLAILLDSPEKMLSTILVCNNIVNILASAITTSLAMQFIGGSVGVAVSIATGIVTLVILIFGEITPKSFAVKNAERIALFIAGPLYVLTKMLTPLIFVLNKVTSALVSLLGGNPKIAPPTYTEQELKTMVSVGHEEGVLNVAEKEMIHNVFEFGDGEVREIMTPRIHVISIDLDAGYDTVRTVYKDNSYTRMPVTKPGSDEIVGFFNIKDIAFSPIDTAAFKVEDYMRPPHFVYEFNNIARVFAEMRRERIAMYGVLDEYGVMVGIITTEDFIEEIVGDINDEYDDAETPAKEVGENEYVVDGTMGIDNFNEVVGVGIESDDFDSIGGFVLGILEDLPTEGDRVEYRNLEFSVESVINNRIESLRVKVREDAESGEPGDGDGRDGRDSREGRDGRDNRDSNRDSRDGREGRDARDDYYAGVAIKAASGANSGAE